MRLVRTFWRTAIAFLLNCIIKCSFQGPVSSSGPAMGIICQGFVSVEPGPLFTMGSNLTVYCTTTMPHCNSRLFIELNGQEQIPVERLNCSTVRLRLTNLREPNSVLICKLERDGRFKTICGLDLHSGYPPDEPNNIACEAPRDSEEIHCNWSSGRETYLVTNYTFSLSRENKTQVFQRGIRRTGGFSFPRSELNEKEQHQLRLRAHNILGESFSQPFIFSVKDIVTPDTPYIVKLEFGNSSSLAVLHWNCSESPELLKHQVEQYMDLGRGLVKVEGLQPLTHYDFQIRVCFSEQRSKSAPDLDTMLRPSSTHGPTPVLTPYSTHRPLCSKWSPSAQDTSPGMAPTRELDVWRVLGVPQADGVQNVTVLWKPLSPDDYSGQVLRYELFYPHEGQRQEVSCPADVIQYSIQLTPEVQVLFVRAVTSFGTSPPAALHLTHTSVSGPVLRCLGPAVGEGGDTVALSWLWDGSSGPGAETDAEAGPGVLLGFVVEWISGSLELGWQRVAVDRNSTLITGLRPGVRYNVSLYAETTWGLSRPSCGLVYSREEKPEAAPKVSILAHESGRVLIQWEELPMDEQRGFITHYNIYVKELASDAHQNFRVTVPASEPSQRWLDYLSEGIVSIQVTASTAAGEGPQGEGLLSQPIGTAVGLVAGVAFVATVVMVIIVNLMCWSCVRKRVKQTCISLGPIWLSENLPKLGNSNAIRLLKQGNPVRQTWSWMFTLSDPPLSQIEEVTPGEKDEPYPIIHTGRLQTGKGEPDTEGMTQTQWTASHIGYKPQTTTEPGQDMEEVEDITGHIPICERTGRCPEESHGLLEPWFPDVIVDLPGISSRLDSSSIWELTPQCTTQTLSLFSGDLWLEEKGLEVGLGYLDSPQGQTVNPEDTICFLAMPMTTDYFPQTANFTT
ncbi:interleukin-23 receptor isoform X2 [Esox lucius]|uniref:interleukin-23 receptor isoform X2 n=1 Tax=Esox lucius TaxID=8010 RepID=UPI00147748A0|nr:interleukin-23 receptor isoform X2 [Esox lucius]